MDSRTLLCAALFAASPAAQTLPEGFATQVASLSPVATLPQVLANGDLVWFDGDELLLEAQGQPPVTLLQLPSSTFGAFTLQIDAQRVLWADSIANTLWLVPLAGPAPAAPLASVAFPYDAVRFDAQRVVLSAKTGGFATPDNDLLVLDLSTGALQPFASLPGASGPVTIAPNGDLYYATASLAFPTPPGQTSVLRLRRPVVDAALLAGTVLGVADAELVFAGLDAAGDMVLDDDGDLLFTDWFQNQLGEIHDATGPSPWRGAPLVDYGVAPGAASLQFVPGAALGEFEPFQPGGDRLLVWETDYFSTNSLRSLAPQQPATASSVAAPIPAGAVTFTVGDGPANGFGLLAIALDGTPGVTAFAIPGFEQTLPWSDVLTGTMLLWPAPFDAQGSFAVPLASPGFATPTAATVQAVLVSTANVLGASAPLPVTFGQ